MRPTLEGSFLHHAPLTERKASKFESVNSDATTAGRQDAATSTVLDRTIN
jgi:hypothetical protein